MTDLMIYKDAINRPVDGVSLLDWIKENILKSEDKKIRVKISDIKRYLGKGFERKSYDEIYDGLKFALTTSHPFENKEANIGIESGKLKKGGDNIVAMYYAYYPELPPTFRLRTET
jgi:hypothetical protein